MASFTCCSQRRFSASAECLCVGALLTAALWNSSNTGRCFNIFFLRNSSCKTFRSSRSADKREGSDRTSSRHTNVDSLSDAGPAWSLGPLKVSHAKKTSSRCDDVPVLPMSSPFKVSKASRTKAIVSLTVASVYFPVSLEYSDAACQGLRPLIAPSFANCAACSNDSELRFHAESGSFSTNS